VAAKDILNETGAVEARSRGLTTVAIPGTHVLIRSGKNPGGTGGGGPRDVLRWCEASAPRCSSDGDAPSSEGGNDSDGTKTCSDSNLRRKYAGDPCQERQSASDEFHDSCPFKRPGPLSHEPCH
jgi:hypothetical protein